MRLPPLHLLRLGRLQTPGAVVAMWLYASKPADAGQLWFKLACAVTIAGQVLYTLVSCQRRSHHRITLAMPMCLKSFWCCDLNTVADARFSLARLVLAARGFFCVIFTCRPLQVQSQSEPVKGDETYCSMPLKASVCLFLFVPWVQVGWISCTVQYRMKFE